MENDAVTSGESDVLISDAHIIKLEQTRRVQLRVEVATQLRSDPSMRWEDFSAAADEAEEEAAKHEDLDRIVSFIFKKSVNLGKSFSLGLGESFASEHGFGILGEIKGEPLASWEWFTCPEEGRGTKLQESGEITFETGVTEFGKEISYMRFDSDVVLRLSKGTENSPRQEVWRIKIGESSELFWPVFGPDGQAISSGQLQGL